MIVIDVHTTKALSLMRNNRKGCSDMMLNRNTGRSSVALVNKLLFIKIPDDVSHLQNKTGGDFVTARLLLLAACVLGALSFVITLRTSPTLIVTAVCIFAAIAVLMQLGIYAAKGLAVLFVGANGFMSIVELVAAQNMAVPLMIIVTSVACLLILIVYKGSINYFIFRALKRSNTASAIKIKQDLKNRGRDSLKRHQY